MPKFSRVAQVQPTKRVWYKIDVLEGTEEGCPEIEVCHAGRTNKPYFSAFLRDTAENTDRGRRRGSDTKTIVKAAVANATDEIERTRELYPEFIVTNWKNVVDDDGALVPFTKDNVAEYFMVKALPDWIVERIKLFCENPINFLDRASISPAAAEDLSGN